MFGRKLPRKRDLQLRVGAAVLTLMVVRRLPEGIRVLARKLWHIARLDQHEAAALLILAVTRNIGGVRRRERGLAGRFHHYMHDGQAGREPLPLRLFLPLPFTTLSLPRRKPGRDQFAQAN